METAPLTLAHTHARNAVLESKRSNPVAASEEHDLAAAEFAAAAQGTADSEALRILNLLEQHHKRLGQILKSRHENATREPEPSPSASASSAAAEKAAPAPPLSARSAETADAILYPPRLTRTRQTARDLSSSIASNLASARGIPSSRQRRPPEPISPSISAEHAGGRFTQDIRTGTLGRQDSDKSGRESLPNHQHLGKPSWTPPSIRGEATGGDPADDKDLFKAQTSDAPFQQFYNTFESLISKLSAPLAFTSLPLTATAPVKPDPTPTPTPKHKPPKALTPTPTIDASIDYSALISRAALRAVRDGIPSNPTESFYVVPTTGGTISYAEIMNRAERESSRHHHNRTLSGISEDDFFEARTTADSASPTKPSSRSPNTKPKKGALLSNDTKTVGGKTMEELALENQALKHLSDTLSKRLHVFELSAQSSSAALAQSIRSLHLSPLNTPENSRDSRGRKAGVVEADAKARARITELEEVLRKSDREIARRREENSKLKETVLRYREKWEKLKEGARARRDVGSVEKDGAGGKGGTASPNLGLGAPVEPETEEEGLDER
jgi:hypothetical protein